MVAQGTTSPPRPATFQDSETAVGGVYVSQGVSLERLKVLTLTRPDGRWKEALLAAPQMGDKVVPK